MLGSFIQKKHCRNFILSFPYVKSLSYVYRYLKIVLGILKPLEFPTLIVIVSHIFSVLAKRMLGKTVIKMNLFCVKLDVKP